MTGVEIKRAAENYVDEAIDDPEAVDAINAALSKIGDIAIIYDTVSITDDVGKQWMALPATTTYVVEVLDSQGKPYHAWRIRDSMIQLRDPGTYTIHYRRLPEPIGGILDTPEVHPAYHNCLVTYVIGWWKLKDDVAARRRTTRGIMSFVEAGGNVYDFQGNRGEAEAEAEAAARR